MIKNAIKSDVIYAMGPVNAGFPAMIASKLTGKKLVVKVVGDYAWEQGVQRFGVKDSIDIFQTKNNYSFMVRLLKWIQKIVVKNSSIVIVPSFYLKNIVVGWGVSENSVVVVYNSSSYVGVCPVEKAEEEKWIISAGRLVPWKGMLELIEIMPEILKEQKNAKLKIYGNGPDLKFLKNKVIELKLEGVVEIPGQLSRKELMCKINKADCFVLNSGYEGLSHLILEALHVNTPVLASRAGGNSELVIPGKNGDLFELNNKEDIKNKILNLLNGEMNLEWSDQEKDIFFEKFSLKSMVDSTSSILKKICQN